MVTTFSTLEHGTDWQSIDFVNEMVDAQNAIMTIIWNAIGASPPLLPQASSGTDINDPDFWLAMQVALVRDAALRDPPVSITQADFRGATEWNPPALPNYNLGFIDYADIIGPWIFEDIRDGINTLEF